MKMPDISDKQFNWEGKAEMKCMNCGKPITKKLQAPSGSMLPRCAECNAKRWKQYYASETEQHGATSSGINENRWIEGYEDPEAFKRWVE